MDGAGVWTECLVEELSNLMMSFHWVELHCGGTLSWTETEAEAAQRGKGEIWRWPYKNKQCAGKLARGCRFQLLH